MKGLSYLDYVKTPNDWKSKALDIPKQVQDVKRRRRFKPSAIVVACVVVLSLSGVGVYAVGSGALDVLKASLFEDKYTTYNYDGVKNDLLENVTDLESYIQTDVDITNLEISRDDIDFKVTGLLCDRDIVYITADLTLPEGETYENYNENAINFADYTFRAKSDSIESWGRGIDVKSIQDNVVSIVMYTISDGSYTFNDDFSISFSDLGTYDGTFEVYCPMDVSFDIHIEDSGISKKVDGINKSIPLLNGATGSAVIESVEYSPLMLTVTFSDLTSSTIDYKDYNMYYIYDDGRKVFISRGYMQSMCNTCGICLNYAHANQTLIDFTNIVAIEINGEVIPLK